MEWTMVYTSGDLGFLTSALTGDSQLTQLSAQKTALLSLKRLDLKRHFQYHLMVNNLRDFFPSENRHHLYHNFLKLYMQQLK